MKQATFRLFGTGSGLSELRHSKFNYQLSNMILDELVPWHKKLYDFSSLKLTGIFGCTSVFLYAFMEALELEHLVTLWFYIICRSLSSVLGFSKETLVALITNIGRKWQRRENIRNGRKPEHPKASSTDDVECFFSVMRDRIGRNLQLKK